MNPVGIALSALNRFAGSELAEKWHLRKPAERIAYRGTRGGFRAANAVAQRFKAKRKLAGPERLGRPPRGDLFDLTLTEEQELITDSARRFAEDELRPTAEAADTAAAAPPEVMSRLSELGLASYAVPEALEGAGRERSPVTNALVAEAFAWGDMGLAVAGLAPIGVANALVTWGSAVQQAKYLPAFVGQEPVCASLACLEPQPLFDPQNLRTRARANGVGYVLQGTKSAVPLGEQAELLLVTADVMGVGPQVFIVEQGTPGMRVHPEPGMGLRAASLARVELDGVKLPRDALLGEQPDAKRYLELTDLARIAWCALAVGTAQAVLDYVIPYCNDRVAFGEPISHRQAVAFMIADMAIEIDGMRMVMLRAASRAEQGLDFHREAYLARVLCGERAMEIGTNGVQLLGGHGYIKDHPVERWYRDLRAAGIFEGGLLI
jgi:alkylation response protein AidB-like acyl-CoA dehydrogenase